MKYDFNFKSKCVELYKNGQWHETPEGIGQKNFRKRIVVWSKIVDLHGIDALRHPQKFIFFNGDAVYDSMWDCEESVGQDFNIKSFKIKKKYADCFASDNPEGFVETLSPAICANCFPGENRTVYTIYNRAYSTYRGKILKVKHIDGAKYYDVWNEKELQVEIKDGYAEIYLTIDAQEMGCIEIAF